MLRSHGSGFVLFFSCIGALTACGSDAQSGRGEQATDGGGGGGADSSVAAPDGSSPSGSDASTANDAAQGGDAGGMPGATCDGATCASLVGRVVRKATTKPQRGGIGNVYVAVFDGNPITDMNNAHVVGRVIVANADLSADTASVAYRVDGVPTRAAEYQVIAFLDDDHDATAQSPAPNKGDLASIDLAGFGGIKVTLAHAGDTSLDLPLNAALP